jgi:hypothetical protein
MDEQIQPPKVAEWISEHSVYMQIFLQAEICIKH